MVTTSALATVAATSPAWLHTLGQIAGTFLLIDVVIALALMAALMVGLAFAAWWLHNNVIPVVSHYGEQAQHVMGIAERGGEAIVEKVATFHGARAGVLTGLRAFIFGQSPEQRETLRVRGMTRPASRRITRPITRPIEQTLEPQEPSAATPTATSTRDTPAASEPELHPIA